MDHPTADLILFPLYHRLPHSDKSILAARVHREDKGKLCPQPLPGPVVILPLLSMPLVLICASRNLLVILIVFFFGCGGGGKGSITIEAVNWTRVMKELELDCYSHPVLVKDGKKKLWEILFTELLFFTPHTVNHLSSSLSVRENLRASQVEGCQFA
jgi:hypothetical protein